MAELTGGQRKIRIALVAAVKKAIVDFDGGQAEIEYEPKTISLSKIIAAVNAADLGYRLSEA